MSNVERQVGRARWRLMINILMQRVAVGVLIATGLWVVMLLIERALVLGLPIWHGLWMAGIVAAAITLVSTLMKIGLRRVRADSFSAATGAMPVFSLLIV